MDTTTEVDHDQLPDKKVLPRTRRTERRTERVVPDRVPGPAVLAFVVVAAAVAWTVCLPLWLGPGLGDAGLLQACAAGMMFAPLIATIVALIVQRRRSTAQPSIPRYLGIWPLKPARRVIWMVVIAFVATFLLAVATLLVAKAFGWDDPDLSAQAGIALLRDRSSAFGSLSDGLLLVIMLAMIIPNALLTAIFAFGEEVGWRGWLLTSLRPLGNWPALLITGTIWGLWHAPLILLGYNFARPDLGGLALMVGGCIAVGVLFGWTRIRTGSVWPAVVAHGMLNAATPTLIMLTTPHGVTPDGAFVALLGFPGWILIAALTIVLVITGQFRRSAELA